MKNFFKSLRALPNGVKHFLAVLTMIVAIVMVIGGWSVALPQRLGNLEEPVGIENTKVAEVPEEPALALQKNSSSPTPVQGLAESLRGLESFIPRGLPKPNEAAIAPRKGFLTRWAEDMERGWMNFTAAISETVGSIEKLIR